MAIPSQTEMYRVVLDVVEEGREYRRKEIGDAVHEALGLTREEEGQVTSSGVPVWKSRVGWAVTWLSDAGCLRSPRRGWWVITEEGSRRKREGLTGVQIRLLAANASDGGATDGKQGSQEESAVISAASDVSPAEMLDDAARELDRQLAHDLLAEIMAIPGREGDTFFEKVVTDLLVAMGYGEGTVTRASNDSGIDGFVRTDPLGFDPILIQAKRYSADNKVGRPEVMGFAGALNSVSRGAFITTSSFTTQAVEFARSYSHADIVLIDGEKLVKLMIAYDLGVSTERIVKVKRIDHDYFDRDR